jgi:chromosome partitioning protein
MDLLDLADAAKLVGASAQTLRNYIREGKLSEYRLGRKIRVSRAEVEGLFNTPLKPRQRRDQARVFVVANQKGGTGKTTTAVSLSYYLAEEGPTLVIDADPQANLTQTFGINPDKQALSLYEVLLEDKPVREAMQRIQPPPGDLHLVGSNIDLADVPRQAQRRVSPATMLRRALEPVLSEFEFVVIDCPPSLDLLTINALAVATDIIVPVEMGAYAVRGTSRLLDVVREVKEVNPNIPTPRFLGCKVTSEKLSNALMGELWRAYRGRLFATTIAKGNRVGESQSKNKPLPQLYPESEPAKDYKLLIKELLHA